MIVLILESVEIISDISYFIELKLKNEYENNHDDIILGFSTIFALIFVLLLFLIYTFLKKKTRSKKKIFNLN